MLACDVKQYAHPQRQQTIHIMQATWHQGMHQPAKSIYTTCLPEVIITALDQLSVLATRVINAADHLRTL